MNMVYFLLFAGLCIVLTTGNAENCDVNGVLLYENMGCKTIHSADGCPKSFECKGLTPSKNKCYYKGNTYKLDEAVPKKLSSGCSFGCICSSYSNRTYFECPAVDCPYYEFPLKNETCYFTKEIRDCCSKLTCPEEKPKPICELEGKEYLEGQIMYPSSSCHVCVCKKGFKGLLEPPYCERINCSSQLHYQEKIQNSCAPVYYEKANEKKCCPVDWICPDGCEKIENKGAKGKGKCSFGQITLQVGQGFTKEETGKYERKITSCECKIPPLLICTYETFKL